MDALQRFADTFEAVARERLSDAALRCTYESDGALAAGELTYELGVECRRCAWGQGFPAPAFDGVFDVADQRVVGDGHARFTLVRERERFAAIAFRVQAPLPPRIHALFRPEIHTFQGLSSLELVVDHWTDARS